MTLKRNSLGFTAVEGILIVVILAMIGIVGYKVYSTKSSTDEINNNTAAAGQNTATSSGSATAPSVNSTSDLDKASSALDSSDTSPQDDADSSSLGSQSSNF